MNSGQSLLVIGAYAVLAVLTLGINSTIITTTTTGLEMESALCALSMAESMMDEIMGKPFDEAVAHGERVFVNSGMTSAASLGPESGEAISGYDTSRVDQFLSKKQFNDVDDYNHYQRMAWDERLSWFAITDTVVYVDEDNLSVTSGQTFHKQITVHVSNPSMSKNDSGAVIPLVIKDISIYRKYF